MSIGFEYSGRVRKKEELVKAVRELAAGGGQDILENENGLWISFCPMGGISLSWERENGLLGQWAVTGECCSTPAGPGFHKAAVEFIETLGRGPLRNLAVTDETEYYEHRDFERMKEERFYRWLKMLINLCQERLNDGEYGSLCLCWNLDQYQPEEISGSVITPMGRFNSLSMVKAVESLGIRWLADRFFVWNNPEKDAGYYRNCALNQLWESCMFAPSARSQQDAACNSRILESLEHAFHMDSRLPLPMEAYRLLCALDGDFDDLKDREDLSMENGQARWGWREEEEEDGTCYQVFCKAVSGPSLFIITVTYSDEKQRLSIYELLRKLKTVK